jgi:membrane associated rhomboid family serine protease
MLGYWFVINFLSGTATSVSEVPSSGGGVAFWAHVGGFVAGMLMVKMFSERPQRYRYGTW